ncbi:MAG TPA: MarR family transcriptional regulator [Gemmatimonadales bacterium]
MEEAIRELGVSLQQYNVLRILIDAGEVGLPTLAVADRLLERAPGVTRLMDRLEAQGLVARSRGEDRRQVVCRATDSGRALAGKARPLLEAAEAAALRTLSPHETSALLHFLNRIGRNTTLA